jgi:hypothetical protein
MNNQRPMTLKSIPEINLNTSNKQLFPLSPQSNYTSTNINQTSLQKGFGCLSSSPEEIEQLKLKLVSQINLIKEYEYWTQILLSIVGDKTMNNTYQDVGTPIQKGLMRIESLQNENLKIKQKIIEQLNKNELLKLQKERLIDMKRHFYEQEYKINKIEELKGDKMALLKTVQLFANEVDELSAKNKKYNSIIKNNEKYLDCLKKIEEFKYEKEENANLKKILEIQNIKNGFLYNNNKIKDDKYVSTTRTIPVKRMPKRLGNYTLEQEEDYNNDFLFSCGN